MIMSKTTSLLVLWSWCCWWASSPSLHGEPFGQGVTHYRGCARAHGPVAACEYCQRYNRLYQHAHRHVMHPVALAAMPAPAAHVTVPKGRRINAMSVQSPYSDYVVTSAALQSGHVCTDHSITPKKNFMVP